MDAGAASRRRSSARCCVASTLPLGASLHLTNASSGRMHRTPPRSRGYRRMRLGGSRHGADNSRCAPTAEPARGGYLRYLGWTMSLLPLPLAWESACSTLAPISRAALSGSIAAGALRDALLEATLAAYGLQHDELAPLLAWFAG